MQTTCTKPSRSLKNSSAERSINCGGATQDVSAATVFATGDRLPWVSEENLNF